MLGVGKDPPWSFCLVLLGTIAWFGACIGVIFSANKTKTDSWAVSPTVILAILGPIGSILLQYALSCGLVISWWSSALRGTTLGTLHRQWDHGTSVLAAITAGRHTDRLALAKLIVLSVFAVNPLLQRSLTTKIRAEREDVDLSTTAATDVQSIREMNFTDVYRDAFYDPVQLAPNMTQIMRQFTERDPITNGITGCVGNCSGVLAAAGIDAQCSTVQNSSFFADYGNGAGGATLVFSANTNVMGYRTGPSFNLSTFFVATSVVDDDDESEYDQMRPCRGVSTAINCTLQHAVIAYPFSQVDGVITPVTERSQLRVLSTEHVGGSGSADPSGNEPIFGGLSIAANSIINSTGIVETMGKYGWGFRTSGPLTATYLSRGGDVRTCAVAFNDPTEDILSKLNEIMFRVALSGFNSSSPPTEFTAQQRSVFIIYESRYAYLWGALAITTLAFISVVPTAFGFESIGRPVTLSPIEIAKAFNAQLLRERGTSNMTIQELMALYQEVEVQYKVIEACDRHEPAEGTSSATRLQFATPEQGRRPQDGEVFAG